MTDAFDTFWRWANKPADDHTTTISAEVHHAVTSLSEEDRHDRDKVNNAVRDALIEQLRQWTSPEDINRLNDTLRRLAESIAWGR
jgi:hypothetical protein